MDENGRHLEEPCLGPPEPNVHNGRPPFVSLDIGTLKLVGHASSNVPDLNLCSFGWPTADVEHCL